MFHQNNDKQKSSNNDKQKQDVDKYFFGKSFQQSSFEKMFSLLCLTVGNEPVDFRLPCIINQCQ